MAFEELKQRQSVMWGNGPYERVTDTLDGHPRHGSSGGSRRSRASGGSTSRAAPARSPSAGGDARAPGDRDRPRPGADRDRAARRAADDGLDIDYRVGDCENLEGIDDGQLRRRHVDLRRDVRAGPRGDRAELARVVAPGGRIALANWTPDGGVGEMFQLMAPFQPPPAGGLRPPFDWGRREPASEELLGDAFDLHIEEHVSTLALPARRGLLGSCSRRATARPRRWPSRSTTTAARSCTGRGSTSSRATTADGDPIAHRARVPARPRHEAVRRRAQVSRRTSRTAAIATASAV